MSSTVTASMGISLYPDDAADVPEILRNADAAMYKAKSAGRNIYQFYTGDLTQRALEMLSTETALRRAVEHQEFVLHYIFELKMDGFRALAYVGKHDRRLLSLKRN